MKNKSAVIVSLLVILLPMLAGLLLWNRLPDELAVHFNSEGVADKLCHKSFAVFAIPLFILAAQILCLFFSAHDPKRHNIGGKLYNIVIWICPACSVISGLIIYLNAFNSDFPVISVVQAAVGLAVIIIGNYLPKCRQNYSLGIKLPWTLNNSDNWNSTHRFAGWVWIAGGFVLMINAFFNIALISAVVIVLMVLLPLIYSFALDRRSASK